MNFVMLLQGLLMSNPDELIRDFLASERQRTSGKIPHFKIDVNIDGSQFFENSAAPQGYPILSRIHSIGIHKIPVRQSPVFCIGIYHGPG